MQKIFEFIKTDNSWKIILSCVVTYSICVLSYFIMVKLNLILPRLTGYWWEAVISYSYISGIISINILFFYQNESKPVQILRSCLWVLIPVLFAMWIMVFTILLKEHPDFVIGAILGHLPHTIVLVCLIVKKKFVHWKIMVCGWIFWTLYSVILYSSLPTYPFLWYLKNFWLTWGSISVSSTVMIILSLFVKRN